VCEDMFTLNLGVYMFNVDNESCIKNLVPFYFS
jgi:hypothetical protein